MVAHVASKRELRLPVHLDGDARLARWSWTSTAGGVCLHERQRVTAHDYRSRLAAVRHVDDGTPMGRRAGVKTVAPLDDVPAIDVSSHFDAIQRFSRDASFDRDARLCTRLIRRIDAPHHMVRLMDLFNRTHRVWGGARDVRWRYRSKSTSSRAPSPTPAT